VPARLATADDGRWPLRLGNAQWGRLWAYTGEAGGVLGGNAGCGDDVAIVDAPGVAADVDGGGEFGGLRECRWVVADGG